MSKKIVFILFVALTVPASSVYASAELIKVIRGSLKILQDGYALSFIQGRKDPSQFCIELAPKKGFKDAYVSSAKKTTFKPDQIGFIVNIDDTYHVVFLEDLLKHKDRPTPGMSAAFEAFFQGNSSLLHLYFDGYKTMHHLTGLVAGGGIALLFSQEDAEQLPLAVPESWAKD